VPARPPKKWFDQCVKATKGADDPKALCGWVWHHHMSATRKRAVLAGEHYDPRSDSPPPKDLTVRCDVMIRTVPEVDNLLEIAIYPNTRTDHDAIMRHIAGLKDIDEIKGGHVRRGKRNGATNIFIMW
jgi:hypothetical protein